MVRDIISRQGDGSIPMDEGRIDRMSGTRQRVDGTERMERKAKREADYKQRGRRRKIREKRWQKRRNRKIACRGKNKATTIAEGKRTVNRDWGERVAIQRRATESKVNTVEGSRMTSGRWTRSKAEGGDQGRRDNEEKGKGVMEEDLEREILSVYDDSNDDVEMFDSDREKGRPGRERQGHGKRKRRCRG